MGGAVRPRPPKAPAPECPARTVADTVGVTFLPRRFQGVGGGLANLELVPNRLEYLESVWEVCSRGRKQLPKKLSGQFARVV